MGDHRSLDPKTTFFLFADQKTERWLGERISKEEYEAFFLSDHQYVRDILEEYGDSILFINTAAATRNFNLTDFVGSLRANVVSSSMTIGIIGGGEEEEAFASDSVDFAVEIANERNTLQCDTTLSRIIGVLEGYQARGRRRYIRVQCPGHYHATFSIKKNNRILNGYINDISSAGMMARFSEPCRWDPDTRFDDLQLRLFGTSCKLSGRVMGSHRGDGQNWVILFDYTDAPGEKQKIQSFISQMLRRVFRERMETMIPN